MQNGSLSGNSHQQSRPETYNRQSIAKFHTEQEVISHANNSEYGLSAAIFTNNVSRAHRVAVALEVGQVTINNWGTLNANTPFGGVKRS